MSFLHLANPSALLLLALVPALAALYIFGDARRRLALSRFFTGAPPRTVSHKARRAKRALAIAAVALVAVAMARPARRLPAQPAPESGDIVFLLDVSRSMFTPDVPPSRLRRARQVATSIARAASARWPGERVSLVAFAGATAVLCPLTVDLEYFGETLDSASSDSVAFGGSRIGDALHFALRYGFDDVRRGAKAIVLLTDGGDQGGPSSVTAEFRGSDVQLIVVGVGDPGRQSPVPVSETIDAPFLYHGVPVMTSLDRDGLKALGGAYFEAGPMFETAGVLIRLAGRPAAAQTSDEYYAWLLAAAILLLAIETSISDRAPRKAAAAALALAFALHAAETPQQWMKQAAEAWAIKQYEAAAQCYLNASNLAPASASIRFDLAVAYYHSNLYAAAENAFQAAAERAGKDKRLRAKSLLGAGNAEYRMAFDDSPQARGPIAELQSAIASYSEALREDPNLDDARHNLEIAKQKLEELKRRRRAQAEQDLARIQMRQAQTQAPPASAAEILQNARKKNAKSSPYRRTVSTDW